jgi:hypothetical protein
LISKAPIQKVLKYADVSMASDDLYIAPLLEDGHIGPVWKDLQKEQRGANESKSQLARCPLLQVADGIAIAAFFVVASGEWLKQLQPSEHMIDYDLLRSARTGIELRFSMQVGGVCLATAELDTRIGGMGEGPVHGYVTGLFKKIFASYAPQDLHMVQLTESILRILGVCNLVWDERIVSPGGNRKEAVCAAISDADVFQLFWSEHAKKSTTVQSEWKYALSLRRDGFVRPVYWSDKPPKPPKELGQLFFSKIPYAPIAIAESLGALLGRAPTITIERVEFMEKQINVTSSGQGNVVNVAEYMVDVVNTVSQNVSQAYATDDLKALLKQLAECIAELAPKIDAAHAERMGSDVKTLSEEMKGLRRPPWYKLALEGIMETAKTIGEVGKPILEIAAKLLPLLLPA